jgi:hypothetical protein
MELRRMALLMQPNEHDPLLKVQLAKHMMSSANAGCIEAIAGQKNLAGASARTL